MAYLHTRRFSSPEWMDLFLRGGVSGSLKLKTKHYGLNGLTLIFTSPAAKTVTFDDSTGAGLSPKEILDQIGDEVDGVAATTEGTTALSALTMASETLTLFLDGSATATEVVFGTESGEVAILAVLNAALSPLGVTATAGSGTPGGVVLTTDDGGPDKSIQVTATGGGQAKLTMAVETQTGTDSIITRFQDGRLVLLEATPTSGIGIDGASTAAAALGFGTTTVTGTVYAAPDGAAPRLVTYSPGGQMDSVIVTTEES